MSISEERSSRYTFKPGQLTPVTNPEEPKRIHEKTGMRPLPDDEQAWNIPIDDLLEYYLKLLTVEGGGKWSDELLDACDAEEYTAGLIIALAACEDQGLKPDRQILRATLASPWCEEGCDADVIARQRPPIPHDEDMLNQAHITT